MNILYISLYFNNYMNFILSLLIFFGAKNYFSFSKDIIIVFINSLN